MQKPLDFPVPSVGAVRRLRALIAMGHPPVPLAFHLAISEQELWLLLGGTRRVVPGVLHDAADRLFQALWDQRVDGPLGERMRMIAQRRRWVGPLAWDDLDDPLETPNIDGESPGEDKALPESESIDPIDEIAIERAIHGDEVRLTRPERLLAISRLHASGLNDPIIARTLRISDKTVLRAREHLGLPAHFTLATRKAESA